MNDITELAQRVKTEASAIDDTQWYLAKPSEIRSLVEALESKERIIQVLESSYNEQTEALEKAQQHIARQEQILLNQDESLSIRRGELEAAQQERENWRTSFDNERFRADKLKAHIDDIEPIRAAAEKLVRCKGRYHSEQNYRALAALFGVNTPDLPPLDSESRPVTLKLPPRVDSSNVPFAAHTWNCCLAEVEKRLTDAGIKWEAE